MRRLQGASSLLCLLEPKVIIVQGYSSPNTTILSGVYNLSTTCFGQCCWGHHQVGYNLSEKLYTYVHYIVIDKQDNTRYMYGSLPSAHTPTDFV